MSINDDLINACLIGNFETLKDHLSNVEDPNVYLNQVYSQPHEQKCTLLVIAYLANQLDFLYQLLECYKPNLEVLNDVRLDNQNAIQELYYDVSILWVVAVTNDLETVERLVQHGADINHRTRTHSTALRGACYNGNISMARFLVDHGADVNIYKIGGDTNLMLSIDRQYASMALYLIEELKCDVNFCSDNGRPALYDAVFRESLELTRLLIDHGALNFRAHLDQMSPLMWAAEGRKRDLMAAIAPIASSLDDLEAEELYATAFCRSHERNYDEYFNDLHRALQCRILHQSPKDLNRKTHAVFHHRQECQTLEELEKFRENPDEIVNEALLMRERLLGLNNREYYYSLRYQAVTYESEEKYHRALELALYEHELHQEHCDLLESDRFPSTLLILNHIVHQSLPITIDLIKRLINLIEKELQTDVEEYNTNVKYLLWLITILSHFLSKATLATDDRQFLYLSLVRIVRQQYKTNHMGSSLLHLSLNENSNAEDSDLHLCRQYPCLQTASLLLKCGADVNEIDEIHQTPLHTLMMNRNQYDIALVELLYRAGAHLDCINALGETAEDLADDPTVKSLLKSRTEMKLKCFCARVIRQNEIPYDGKIAKSLVNFVNKH